MYYNIKLINKLSNEVEVEEIVESKNSEEAIEKVVSISKELPCESGEVLDWLVECNEMSIHECIEKEMYDLKKEIARKYIENHYDINNMPFREYSQLLKLIVSNDEYFYTAIKDINKYLRIRRRFLRDNDIKNVTMKNYEDYLKSLHNAESEDVFNRILYKVKHIKSN